MRSDIVRSWLDQEVELGNIFPNIMEILASELNLRLDLAEEYPTNSLFADAKLGNIKALNLAESVLENHKCHP